MFRYLSVPFFLVLLITHLEAHSSQNKTFNQMQLSQTRTKLDSYSKLSFTRLRRNNHHLLAQLQTNLSHIIKNIPHCIFYIMKGACMITKQLFQIVKYIILTVFVVVATICTVIVGGVIFSVYNLSNNTKKNFNIINPIIYS